MSAPGLHNRRRLIGMMVCILAVFLLLISQLVDLQIVRASELQEKALDQWTRDLPVSAERGRILDRNRQVLAQSGTAYMVLASPNKIKKKNATAEETAQYLRSCAGELAVILDMEPDFVLSKLTPSDDPKKAQQIVLKRQISREAKDKVKALEIPGIATAIDTRRYYPLRTMLSQVIGFTTIDGVGQEGLELKYNKYLSGRPGRTVMEADARGSEIPFGAAQYDPPLNGSDIVLTVDVMVQSFLEKAMDEALSVNRASNVQGIVINPQTGAILALGSKPDFDLNNPPRSDLELMRTLMRNRIVTDSYEPGSTFKVITLAAGLNEGVVTSSSEFNCTGSVLIDGERIKCWSTRAHGHQTLEEGVQHSCNPVFIDIALRLAREKFYDYIYAFGFGSSTDSGLAGEGRGIVRHIKYVRNVDLARTGFGQSIAVTPIQLATAVSAAINGGKLMRPYIVQSIRSPEGEIIQSFEPQVVREVITEQTSAQVRAILESVVESGSGKNAYIEGYRVGGKTGTAQKYENGQIARGKLIASFIGFAPADDPQFLCLILVDEPQVGVIFGSTVAAPHVKNVLEETLRYYDYRPQYGDKKPREVEVPDVRSLTLDEAKAQMSKSGLTVSPDGVGTVVSQMPLPGAMVSEKSEVLLYMTSITQDDVDEVTMVEVPDVSELSPIAAHDKLEAASLEMRIEGDAGGLSLAYRQTPRPGISVEAGSVVIVEFRSPEKPS